MDEIKDKAKAFAEYLESLSEEERRKGNEMQSRSVKEEHHRFAKAYSQNLCYLCGKPLKTFSKRNPCIHWLLKPNGFKKKDFQLVYENYGFFQMQSYLRWVANQSAPLSNINDLSEEGSGNKLFELTIRLDSLEWSFSCAMSDYRGHGRSPRSSRPHYHFQMRIDNRPFIRFNDFHIPLTEMDIIEIEVTRSLPQLVKRQFSYGEGISEVLQPQFLESVLNSATSEGTPAEAPLSIDSFVEADEGTTIKGEDLQAIIDEAKEKGVTLASLLHKLPNTKTKVFVGPGPGVVEQAPRSARKKKK